METYRNLATDIDYSAGRFSRGSTHSEFSTKADGGYWSLGFIGGGDVKVSGKHDSESVSEFREEMEHHLRSTFHQTNEISRMAESSSITEVSSHRTVEREVNDEEKRGVRVFRNINHCHTLTFLFYQIARRQTVTMNLIGVTYRVPSDAVTSVRRKGYLLSLADNQEVVKLEDRVKLSESRLGYATFMKPPATQPMALLEREALPMVKMAAVEARASDIEPPRAIHLGERQDIIKRVAKELPQTKFKFDYSEESLLPTNAVFVDSALGACLACEPYVIENQNLELERQRLENEKLSKEIELLEKHQLYRCCPDKEDDEG